MNLIIMILLISLLILVHEMGHFIAAKIFKMKVEKFAFGLPFGPTLFSKKIGETEFIVHSFLFGGYISFPDDENPELPADSKERFKNRPVYQRAIVIISGVLANVICAYFLVFLTGLIWGELPSNAYKTTVTKILPSATKTTKESGIKPGDVIYEVNDSLATFPIVMTKYLTNSRSFDGFIDEQTAIKKEKELKQLNPNIKSEKETIPIGTIIKIPSFEEEAPLKYSNDEILGFERIKTNEKQLNQAQTSLRDDIYGKKQYRVKSETTLSDIAYAISDTYKPVIFTVIRDGELVKLNKIYPDEKGFMGIEKQIEEILVPTKTFKALVVNTARYINYNVKLIIYGLGKIFTGKIPMQEMHGIVAITKIGSDAIGYYGLFKGFLLTAMISLNLAIINLLPIPALDGGHLFFLIVEKIRGRELNEKITEVINNFFFYLLILLMILIIFNDVFALVTKQI